MLERVIDLTKLVLPNAHSKVFDCTFKNNNFVGYIVDNEGNVLNNLMNMENGKQGYFLIYENRQKIVDGDNVVIREHYVPDFTTEEPTHILRIKLNTSNMVESMKIMKFIKAVMAPWTLFLKIFMKFKGKQMIDMGAISTWSITSSITYSDAETGIRVAPSKIKLMTVDFQIEELQASFGNIMLDY